MPSSSLKTSSITAEVELRPDLRVTFKDAGGNVINEDLPGKELGITLDRRQDHRVQAAAGRRALHRHGRAARESRPARDGAHAQEHGQLPVRRSQGSDVREHSLLHGTASREGLRALLQQLLSIRVQLRRVQSPLRVVQLRWRRAGPVLHLRRVGRQDPRALHLAHRQDAAAAALEPRLPAVAVQLLSGKPGDVHRQHVPRQADSARRHRARCRLPARVPAVPHQPGALPRHAAPRRHPARHEHRADRLGQSRHRDRRHLRAVQERAQGERVPALRRRRALGRGHRAQHQSLRRLLRSARAALVDRQHEALPGPRRSTGCGTT